MATKKNAKKKTVKKPLPPKKEQAEIARLTQALSESRWETSKYRDSYECVHADNRQLEKSREIERASTEARLAANLLIVKTIEQSKNDMMEVVRWQTNPETTKHPFRPAADQLRTDPCGGNTLRGMGL